MRIVVISDTHHDFRTLKTLVDKHRENADVFIHLGDGMQELAQIQELYPDCKFLSARGNCDFGAESALAGCFRADDANIFYTHGHMFNVKYGLDEFIKAARDIGANVALFGHTHMPFCEYRDGLHLLNPGSLGMPRGTKPTYGIVDVTPQGIVCFLNELEYQ